MTRMTLPAKRGLGQRTPASSIHMDKGSENQGVRTSASTPALVPLLAVLVAALPVPGHENLRASLAAITSLSFLVGIRSERSVEIGRENEVLGMLTPVGHVALEDIHHTLSNFEFTFLSSVFSTFSLRAMTKGIVAYLATPVTELHLSRNMPRLSSHSLPT